MHVRLLVAKERKEKLDIRIEVLRHSTLFSCLSSEQLSEITPLAEEHRFAKGEFIFHEGDPPNFLYVIASGKVKQFKVSASGRSFTAAIMASGDPLNAVAMFGARTFFVSAQAMTETTVLRIGRKDFLAYVDKYPIVATTLVSLAGRVLNSAWERLTDFAGEMACQRVFNVLYMLFFKFGDAVPTTREEIADMAGTTTETTIRVLGRLKKLGIIDSGRCRITILNEARLREVCGTSYLIREEHRE
jgi:CRP/FNR family transcriptional regulator, nitrogen oxide reductase regulator